MTNAYAHFIGIGGAGMSGIARVLAERGDLVTGSDMKQSRYSRSLEEIGVGISYGHDAANLGSPEIVVVSSAIPRTNPEYAEAVRRDIRVWPRAQMLAHLAGDQRTLAVAGTHGKTTTSSMLATMLAGLDLDPTFLIGGEVKAFGSNAHGGTGDYYVVEADESDGSFTFLNPHVAMVTNVEADHLDFYDGIEQVEEKFAEFVGRTDADGYAVLCADDPRATALAAHATGSVLTYGSSEHADVRWSDALPDGEGHRFRVAFPGGVVIAASIGVPGIHNVMNATGVLAIAYALGLDLEAAARALGGFAGVRRRFDVVGDVGGVMVVDDYAHHPTEVKATLIAARSQTRGRVWVVFQPHRFSRTAALADDFGAAFGQADKIVLMDVYAAGEVPVPGVTGKTLVESVLDAAPRSHVAYFPHRADIARYVAASARSGDLVFTMGAGDVTALGSEILSELAAVQGHRADAS